MHHYIVIQNKAKNKQLIMIYLYSYDKECKYIQKRMSQHVVSPLWFIYLKMDNIIINTLFKHFKIYFLSKLFKLFIIKQSMVSKVALDDL